VQLLSNLVTSPVRGPIWGMRFVVNRIKDQVEAEMLDEGKVQADLLDLTLRYEHGEIDDDEYNEQEAAILARLNDIRAYKESLAQPTDGAME
jgi:gas vesicle protein GvpG